MRYHQEILGSLILQGVVRKGDSIDGLPDEDLALLQLDWGEEPPCIPPGPCKIFFPDVHKSLLEASKRIMASAHAFGLVAEKNPAEVTHYLSTHPGAHWKPPKDSR